MVVKLKPILFFIISMMIFVACKTKGKAVNSTVSKTSESATSTTSELSTPLPDSVYRFNISFISTGTGVDRNAKRQFVKYINEFGQKHNVTVKYESISWGKEGETDYCFKLSELNKELQNEFIVGLKDVLKDSKRIRYNENTPCRKAGNK